MSDSKQPTSDTAGSSKSQRSDFESFQARLMQGDSAARNRFFDDYSRKLVALAGKHIHPALQKRFDGEDVVQSVFRTFFRRYEQGQFEIARAQQMWQVLATLTLCKTRSLARKHTAARRDARADRALPDQPFASPEPSAEDAVALWEEIDIVLTGLPARAADILGLRLFGMNKTDIARDLSVSRQTVHRLLNLIEERLRQRIDQISLLDSPGSENSENSM